MSSSSTEKKRLPWDHDLPMNAEDYDLSEICINSLWDMNREDLVKNHLLPVLQARKTEPASYGIPTHAKQSLFLTFKDDDEGKKAREILLNHEDWGQYSGGRWCSRIGFKIPSNQ